MEGNRITFGRFCAMMKKTRGSGVWGRFLSDRERDEESVILCEKRGQRMDRVYAVSQLLLRFFSFSFSLFFL